MKTVLARIPGWASPIFRPKLGIPIAIGIAAAAGVVVVTSFMAFRWQQEGVPTTSPVAAATESIDAGERLFQSNCTVCHGTDGKGSILAPDLTVHIPTRNDGFIFNRITNGFPDDSKLKTMPTFKKLFTETERWHLVNYLRESFGEIQPVLPEGLSR